MVAVAALPVVFWFRVGTSAATIARYAGTPDAPFGDAKNRFAASELRVTANVPLVVIGEPDTLSSEGTVIATLVTVPDPDVLIVLHPNPVPGVQIRAFVEPSQDGSAKPDGVVAVRAPRTVLAVCTANAVFGIALAATVSDGVVVEFVMVGTSHMGHEADGAETLVTVPEPLGVAQLLLPCESPCENWLPVQSPG